MNNSIYKFIDFIYDPEWDEKTMLKAYYDIVKKDEKLYRVKTYLDFFRYVRTFNKLEHKFSTLELPKESQPLYLILLPYIKLSYNKHKIKEKKDYAIQVRLMWFQDMFEDNNFPESPIYWVDFEVNKTDIPKKFQKKQLNYEISNKRAN